MENIFQQNAYHILGLDASATSAEITNRFEELSIALENESNHEFALDLPLFNQIRTKDSLRTVSQKISSKEIKLKEFFFWFLVTDEADKKAIHFIKNKDYRAAIKTWESSSLDTPFLHQRNLALLYTMLLATEDDNNYLNISLIAWKELIMSENFWSHFALIYKQYGDANIENNLLDHFKKNIINDLFEIYSNPTDISKTNNYINQFRTIFPLKSASEHIFIEITQLIDQLEKAKQSHLLPSELEQAVDKKDIFEAIKSELEKISSLGLYQDEQTLLLRDRACEALINNMHDVRNNPTDIKKNIKLLQDALIMSYLPEVKLKVKALIQKLEHLQSTLLITKPINDLISAGRLKKAYEMIVKCQRKYAHIPTLQNFLVEKKKECITILALAKWKKGRKLLNGPFSKETAIYYKDASQLIYDNIELFGLEPDMISEVIFDIKKIIANMDTINVNNVEEYRNNFIRDEMTRFQNNFENIMLIILIDGYFVWGIYQSQLKAPNEGPSLAFGIISLLIIFFIIYLFT
ncbi:MAG: hypothetical protein P4M14_11640 [Gammaproteobacteria bacterium]|nr:hypothetical protein [Gammaproteobacteria bacterium]